MEQGKKSYLGWPDAVAIVGTMLCGTLALVGWPPGWTWDWSAFSAIGNWAAAVGTVAAVVVALRLGRRDEDWRQREYEAADARSRVQIVSSATALRHLVKELASYERDLRENLGSVKQFSKRHLEDLADLADLLLKILQKAVDLKPSLWAHRAPSAAEDLAIGTEHLDHGRQMIQFASEFGAGRNLETETGCKRGAKQMAVALSHWKRALEMIEAEFPELSAKETTSS